MNERPRSRTKNQAGTDTEDRCESRLLEVGSAGRYVRFWGAKLTFRGYGEIN